ncbi:MAG: hypothetical protein AB1728_11095 [Bacteroidota bacterium]
MRILTLNAFLLLLSGCATVFKGYESEIVIQNAPADLVVSTSEGIRIPSRNGTKMEKQFKGMYLWEMVEVPDYATHTISLRSGHEYLLLLKSGEKESRVIIYPNLGAGWLILDMLCGVFPAWIDMHLGTWMYYDPIDYNSLSVK